MNVGAVDADQHKSLGGQYGVQGFPTIKIFGANKNQPKDYQGNLIFVNISCKIVIRFYNCVYPMFGSLIRSALKPILY